MTKVGVLGNGVKEEFIGFKTVLVADVPCRKMIHIAALSIFEFVCTHTTFMILDESIHQYSEIIHV